MTRQTIGQTRINFCVHKPVLEALKHIARLRGTTYSDLIRVACREYVLKYAEKAITEEGAIKAMGGQS